jgi:hypothetical protein
VDRRLAELGAMSATEPTLIHAIKTDDPAGIEAYWELQSRTIRHSRPKPFGGGLAATAPSRSSCSVRSRLSQNVTQARGRVRRARGRSLENAPPAPECSHIGRRESEPLASHPFLCKSPVPRPRDFARQPPRKRGPPGWGAGCPRHGKSRSRRCRLPGRGVTQAGASQWIAVSLPKVERSLQHGDGADGGSGAAQNWRFMSQHRQREPASDELDVLAPHSSLRRAG